MIAPPKVGQWTLSKRSFAGCRARPTGSAGVTGAIEKFRTVCEDYRDCLDAMARFQSSDPAKAEEYRQLAAELLAEAAAMLRGDRR